MKFDASSIVDIVKSKLQNVLGSLTKNMAIQAVVLVPIAIWCQHPIIVYSLTALFIFSNLFSKCWYWYFAKTNPNLLHSEEHTREMTKMALGAARSRDVTEVQNQTTMDDLDKYLTSGKSENVVAAGTIVKDEKVQK